MFGLPALNIFHEAGYVHTDVRPVNILVNYDNGTNRFSEVELGDCADAYCVDPNADTFEKGHVIGAAIFRSPEANLPLRWGTAISTFADEERHGILAIINNYINKNGFRKPLSIAGDPELTVEDRNFICKIMRMDPRDRPTAKELLEDPLFY
ncbi:hypothetical protein K458DRAFT_473477 [Lentithecium fluviatile CBS 122367]|uniref:EKC/KEOPS complex subunit BUD32 n=1 Tax=Lentithecium fluviatile CBS 122367 TaxID=1168545 RepID=A0A6G1JMG5_9PLEO|nr:hypothetical protein K458DRAFT_473477 [Lentithecium fluviatile CBS 122367]